MSGMHGVQKFLPGFEFRVWGLGLWVWGMGGFSKQGTPRNQYGYVRVRRGLRGSLLWTKAPIWGTYGGCPIFLSQKQPFRCPFANLSRAFARRIFLRCPTNLIQILFTCPVFDRCVESLEVLLGPYMVRGLNNDSFSKRA